MSTSENEFERLMAGVRAGDPQAGRELFERYGKHIQMVVRRRLHQNLRSQFDSLDFAQEAWASFFDIPPDRYTFQTPEELVAFLTRLVQNKMADAYRRRFPGGKGAARALPPSTVEVEDQPDVEGTPSQFAMAKETWERFLEDKPPQVRQAMEMLRAGYSRQEIAQSLGIHPKMIQRLLQKLDDRLRSS
jgi:RNA polymerase sigma factor (sigma-70 family)